MKKLIYQAEHFNTDDAHAVMLELETELGINLSVKDAKNPNVVHGYVNTSSDGTIEVCLYEAADVTRIDAMPQYKVDEKLVLRKVKEFEGIYRKASIADITLKSKVESVLSKRGMTKLEG
jgi:hypothetical protein